MGIHQLSVNHDERHDRLLWRVNTQEGEEFRFWLTRRMAARLLPAIGQAVAQLESQRSGLAAPDPQTRQWVSEMQREAFLQQADFQTPFAARAGAQLPLGAQPLLVTDAQLTVLPPALLQLVLQDHSEPQARQCELKLAPELVHGLLHLSRQAIDKADWALEALVPVDDVKAEDLAAPGPGYAH